MIISRTEVSSAVSAYRAVKRRPGVGTITLDTADSFERSEAASSFAALISDVVSDPFYRRDLVEDLRRRISEGRYFVPTDEIVDKLLGRLIVEAATA